MPFPNALPCIYEIILNAKTHLNTCIAVTRTRNGELYEEQRAYAYGISNMKWPVAGSWSDQPTVNLTSAGFFIYDSLTRLYVPRVHITQTNIEQVYSLHRFDLLFSIRWAGQH